MADNDGPRAGAAVEVTTWADGYGIWQARVVDSVGVGAPAARAIALAAIRAELREREPRTYDPRTTNAAGGYVNGFGAVASVYIYSEVTA